MKLMVFGIGQRSSWAKGMVDDIFCPTTDPCCQPGAGHGSASTRFTKKGYAIVTLPANTSVNLKEARGHGHTIIPITTTSGSVPQKMLDQAYEEYISKCEEILSGEKRKASASTGGGEEKKKTKKVKRSEPEDERPSSAFA